ncbi:hypothetical protein [Herbaspirillum camelliae]|uniref:hypothetical protein n=1 Tax=Herbaspirillum camelliae TaxID=1892903 RepID=UPI001E2FD07D|nr:hypothetical protein [Herbaspirillum camelliae]
MMAIDSQHVAVHLIVSSGMSFRWSSPCRRACSASAFALHFAQHPMPPSRVQASCLERARPVAVAAFAGGWLRAAQHRRDAEARSESEGQRRNAAVIVVKAVARGGAFVTRLP